ncbi:MAG: hypothetical protein ACRD1V_04245 [Vicinamibacterales bacterium]
MIRKLIQLPTAVFVGACALMAVGTAIYAADGAKEAATAAQHATLASRAADIDQTHMHLHHVVNCLVGPNGEGFDASAANPCKALGNGAIPDTSNSATKATLMDALKTANAGLASDDLKTAKTDAAKTAAILKKVK